ncbi:YaiI/YqxD family protein [Dethiobacter alkaliphilus]|uniref:UPF0178 protein DealDRAFT_2269 n=1 Tax=Dethiobacter alkaliphilus AHT 1 TaxID=555088 RepID=C0GIG0_DETAL|nr:DUF188 domain-containing protein [Dethiobacter alkaliphilus]EEG76821.1 protein of unknown function DUF188 [Dethiobacter alkaliphilus AHT 1]MCW3490989.1 DUF188 domain-containing protein [Dethiobacter alkaliphilus]
MKILIDADACPKPVLAACKRAGKKYGLPVWTVASFNHNIESDHHVVVGDSSQEADIKVLNLTDPGDVVVTQDWGLAAMVLGKGAYCLSPHGKEYQSSTIEFMLETREAMAKFRRGGGKTKGPKKRTAADNRKFSASLEMILQKAQQK